MLDTKMKKMMLVVWVVKKSECVFRIYLLLLCFEDVYSIEIVFRIAGVLTEQDWLAVEHCYKIGIVDYYCYYLQGTDFDRIVELVLVEMLAMDLKNRKRITLAEKTFFSIPTRWLPIRLCIMHIIILLLRIEIINWWDRIWGWFWLVSK